VCPQRAARFATSPARIARLALLTVAIALLIY